MTYSFVLGQLLCVYDIIITFPPPNENSFAEKMLATMENLVLLQS
jgi:hypothetical protein